MKIDCAIIAGGKAVRMNGYTKAFLKINNEKIIDRNLKILNPIFNKISLICNQPDDFTKYKGLTIHKDIYKNTGPLAGIHSSLINSNSKAVFIFSSDLPFLSSNIISKLINRYKETKPSALIPKIDNKIEPLHGIYSTEIISEIEKHILSSKKKSVIAFLNEIDTEYLDLENTHTNRQSFYNVNYEEDLKSINEL